MTSQPTNPELDELQAKLNRKLVTEIVDMVCVERSDLEDMLKKEALKARIDELKYWQWKTDGHIELSGKEVEDRLAALSPKDKEK